MTTSSYEPVKMVVIVFLADVSLSRKPRESEILQQYQLQELKNCRVHVRKSSLKGYTRSPPEIGNSRCDGELDALAFTERFFDDTNDVFFWLECLQKVATHRSGLSRNVHKHKNTIPRTCCLEALEENCEMT